MAKSVYPRFPKQDKVFTDPIFTKYNRHLTSHFFLFGIHFPGIIWRAPARGVYEVVQSAKRKKVEKVLWEAEMAERRRVAKEKRAASLGVSPDDLDDYYEEPPRRRPAGRKPPPRNGRRRRPMRA